MLSAINKILVGIFILCFGIGNSLVLVERTIEWKVFSDLNLTTFTADVTNMKGDRNIGMLNGFCQQTRISPKLELCTYNIFTDKWTVRF